MRERLRLETGDTLDHEDHHEKGFMGETEVDTYTIRGAAGEKKGRVQFTEHTSVKAPHTRSCRVMQWDADGRLVVDEQWVES